MILQGYTHKEALLNSRSKGYYRGSTFVNWTLLIGPLCTWERSSVIAYCVRMMQSFIHATYRQVLIGFESRYRRHCVCTLHLLLPAEGQLSL